MREVFPQELQIFKSSWYRNEQVCQEWYARHFERPTHNLTFYSVKMSTDVRRLFLSSHFYFYSMRVLTN